MKNYKHQEDCQKKKVEKDKEGTKNILKEDVTRESISRESTR